MTARDHTAYSDEIGAYLLGALTDLERQAFEHHLESCAQCRDEVERLRPAAESLPRSVEQVEPPRSLRTSLMDVVAKEARERPGARVPRRSLRERLLPGGLLRPALVGGALALGLLAGFGVAQLGSDGADEVRRLRPPWTISGSRPRAGTSRSRARVRTAPSCVSRACPRSGARGSTRPGSSATGRSCPSPRSRWAMTGAARWRSGQPQRRPGSARDARATRWVARPQRAAAPERPAVAGRASLRPDTAPLL